MIFQDEVNKIVEYLIPDCESRSVGELIYIVIFLFVVFCYFKHTICSISCGHCNL